MSIFDGLFKKKQERAAAVVDIPTAHFTSWSGGAYENDIYREGVDAISRNAAKLKGSHVIHDADKTNPSGDGRLNRILQTQPNPYMSAHDMFYKLCTHYYLYNNAFAYIQKDTRGAVTGIYPLRAYSIQFYSDPTGALYCQFLFANGKEALLPYADIIHLRRHFNDNDLLGDSNTALIPALELAHTQNEGITTSIKSSANIRGILHFTQIMAPAKLKEEKERFMGDYLSIANSGGIVATDQKTEYTPITNNVAGVDKDQIEATKTKIYNYLGITEKIVNSSYDENEFAAFYESVIEPYAIQMSLEFTRKLFTDREQSFGNAIIFEAGRLLFSSNTSRIRLVANLMPYGLLTINQALEILNLPAVEDGDKRLQTLNVVDASKANQYQLDSDLDRRI